MYKIISSEKSGNFIIDTYESGIIVTKEILDHNKLPDIDLSLPEKPEKPQVDNSDLKYLEKKLIEQDKKIFKLESENADVLLDLAVKDAKLVTLENDMSDMMLEIIMGGMR